MKLICNLSMLGQRPTGLGVYAENCIAGLAERFCLGLIAGTGFQPPGEVLVQAPKSIAIGGGKWAALERLLWMRSLRFCQDSLVYSPTHHGLPCQKDQIITVHDLICLRFPAQHRFQYLFFRFRLPRLLKKCRAVFTVSETTRQDIANTYGYPANRIYVVPNGVDTTVFSPSTTKSESPFLLMVGARYPHKNVDEVLNMASVWKQDYRLIITSCEGSYRQQLEKKVLAFGLSDQVEFRNYLSFDELCHLYREARALLYPSLWEGFGIPPLEALACGTPVIVSDIPVHREVLGDAAQFIKLGSSRSWAEAVRSIGDSAAVDTYLSEGRKLLTKFTWKRAVDVLEHALLKIEPRLEETRL